MSREGRGLKSCVRLSPADNVAVAVRNLDAGEVLTTGMEALGTALEPIPAGHKVAIVAIAAGDRIRKFGVPVGSATQAIPAGRHVHMHNVKSDYLDNVEAL